MSDYAIDAFGRIDCLVNNAGSPSPMVSILDEDIDNFDRVMAVNVRGVVLGMKYVIPRMLRQGGGNIINMSSGAAFRTGFTAHTYAASKAAVSQLTRSVAAEVGEKGIRVNSISPGAVVTGIFAKNAGVEGSKADRVLDAVKAKFAPLQPIGHAGMTDDVANAAVFLASDRASFVHGHDLVIDGGITLAGFHWQDGVDFRAGLYSAIKQTVEQLNN
jgi:NAD(P)-dependent dehydrogenase (short-subunit alcohol dehydrogenase family)